MTIGDAHTTRKSPAPERITGERVMTMSGGFNPTWQRHVAAYAEASRLLGPGRVIDVGCGIGHSYHLLDPRVTIGVDIDPEALDGQDRETAVADMRQLPFGDAEFESVVSIHSIEHVPDPDRSIDEMARVMQPDGVAVIVTPNRLTLGLPDEIIDPYHWIEFDGPEFHELCSKRFGSVEVLGVFGSARHMELFDEERVTMRRVLAADPLRLRRLLTRRMKQRMYDFALRMRRRDDDPRAAAITTDDFELRPTGLQESLDLFAVCREPHR